MGRINIDWKEMFGDSSTSTIREDRRCLGSPSSAPPHSAAGKMARARAGAGAGAGAEVVARARADDEQLRGAQALSLRLEALCGELEGRVGELTRAAAKVAADREGLRACSAAENVHSFNLEDEQEEHVAFKYTLKPSRGLVRIKKDPEQADGDRKCKRVARPAAKNDDKEPAAPEEIFEVLREIPSLERADLLTAYSTLIRDDRLFRSLMALPKDMRKDWLLMEIRNQ